MPEVAKSVTVVDINPSCKEVVMNIRKTVKRIEQAHPSDEA